MSSALAEDDVGQTLGRFLERSGGALGPGILPPPAEPVLGPMRIKVTRSNNALRSPLGLCRLGRLLGLCSELRDVLL